MDITKKQTIPDFFAGKNIFITGATGFLGKALIEKLLRSAPKIGTIYILLRPKRGKGLDERLKTLMDDRIYETVKSLRPELKMEKQIVPLAGDMNQLNLGLSPGDRQILLDNVNLIYHVAASVRFDDPLTDAVIMNIRGTREVCTLALESKHLAALIHVSTAFANCDRPEANEMLYPAISDWKKIIEVAEKFDKQTLNALSTIYMDKMPNTYCFTKNIAEHVVFDMCKGKIPTKIFRPSIVISSLRDEPVKGWIDNFNGPVGILVAYGKGVMRTMYAHCNYKPDYIPVDVVTKALIVCSWDISVRKNKTIPEIIHCTSHNTAEWLRPSIQAMSETGLKVANEYPLNDTIWSISTHTTTSTIIWYIRTVLFMLLPALLVDAVLFLTGKKPMLFKLQRKMYIAQMALKHFLNNEWSYSNNNLMELQQRILPEDKEKWDYEFSHYSFEIYVKDCIIGCRRYLLNEPDSTLAKAKLHSKRMKRLNAGVQIFFLALCMYFLWSFGCRRLGIEKIGL